MKKILNKYFSAIKEFLPEKSFKPSIGLDIGATSCKIIEVVVKNGIYEINDWAIEPIAQLDVQNSLKRIFTKMNIPAKTLSSAVSGKGTLIRYINMPKMPLEDLRNSVSIEADKHFPFSKDQIYTDCFILNSQVKDNQMHVLVAASKKEIIDQRMRMLAALGSKADFIGMNSIAIANVLNVFKDYPENQANTKNDNTKEGAVAVLDMGHTTSSLVILKDALPLFNRDIFMGGQDLNKAISNVLAVSVSDAERIKHHSSERLEEIKGACESVLTNLSSEIRLSFDYFVTERNAPISKLLLTGGSSLLVGIDDFFAKNLDVPVERWNPLPFFKCAPSVHKEDLNKNINQLGVALGLALYHYD